MEHRQKNINLIFAILIGIALTASTWSIFIPQEYDPVVIKKNIDQVSNAVVYIEGENANGSWSGSGVLIDDSGIVLTAGHVVEDALRFRIELIDGSVYYSDEYYKEDASDVGFIKIRSGRKLKASKLCDSNTVNKGDTCFIIGNPYGRSLGWTVTKGIVSGIKRDLDVFGDKLLMQADAQSWPGNSGGPVYNYKGEVIGILVGGVYGANGISLIVPSNVCTASLSKLKAVDSFERVQ